MRQYIFCGLLLLAVGIDTVNATERGVYSDPSVAYAACQGRGSTDECAAYARSQGATVYVAPGAKTRVLERVERGRYILLTETAKEADSSEWIRTYTVLDSPNPRYKGETVTHFGYVPRSQVILDTDFRRVTGCWPVKYLKDPQGGHDYYPGAVYFTMQGIGSYPHHPVSAVEYGEQRTYYADGVFTVRHEKYSDRHLYGHGVLDYASRTVLHAGTIPLKEGEQLQWFSPEEMKDCKQVPTVDLQSRAPNPTAFKRH